MKCIASSTTACRSCLAGRLSHWNDEAAAYQLDEILFLLGHAINSVALCFEVLQHLVNAAEHIQVGGCSNIALVRRETEDCDGHLLLSNLLLGKAAVTARHCQS